MTLQEKFSIYDKTACSKCGRSAYEAVVKAVEEERERCAKIADQYHRIDNPGEIGAEIRKGTNAIIEAR